MDRDERINSMLVVIRNAVPGFLADVWTAMPAVVESYNAEKRTVEAQVTVQGQTQNKESGEWSNVNLPVLPDVPVLFPGGGDYLLTFPLKKGDEGLVVFCSRCIDSFWQSGGVQPPAEQRRHDLSDGIFIPGALSQKQEIADISTENAQLRSKDGTLKIELETGGKVNIVAPGGVNVTGNLTVSGNIVAGGEIEWPQGKISATGGVFQGVLTATGDVTAGSGDVGGGVKLKTHVHTSGGSGQPTSPPTPGS